MPPSLLLYNLLLHAAIGLAGPLVLTPLLMRDKWRATLADRSGLSAICLARRGRRPLWVHALSVGEVLSALPLVAALRGRRPTVPVVFSTTTLTGWRIASERLGRLADGLFYFPYDLPLIVNARLRQLRPAAVILVETDLWPNFLARAGALGIPVLLVNARLSRRSFAGYRGVRALSAPMFRRLAAVAAQTGLDAQRFCALGVPVERLTVAGNLKFDQPDPGDSAALAAGFRRRLGVGRHQPVLVAGSTHRADEAFLLDAFRRWQRQITDLVCVVAPRDPERAVQIAHGWMRRGLACRLWSRLDGEARHEPVVVVDEMGVLRRLYAAASVAFVGGSFAGCGGHNPLEPAAMARPILYGPDMSDFALVADELESAGGAVRVKDERQLYQEGLRLLVDPAAARRMGDSARQVFLVHRGAVEKTLDLLDGVLAARMPEDSA
jgi:3-deoxy-D-manno-octulosonic-acid transferase